MKGILTRRYSVPQRSMHPRQDGFELKAEMCRSMTRNARCAPLTIRARGKKKRRLCSLQHLAWKEENGGRRGQASIHVTEPSWAQPPRAWRQRNLQRLIAANLAFVSLSTSTDVVRLVRTSRGGRLRGRAAVWYKGTVHFAWAIDTTKLLLHPGAFMATVRVTESCVMVS
ncbi:hypothetical protein KCU65_g409, partial [Aureobasidium melanogenum]